MNYTENREKHTHKYGGCYIIFSADDLEVVDGMVYFDKDSRAELTMHQELVMPITEVVKKYKVSGK